MHAIRRILALLCFTGLLSCGRREVAVPEFTDGARATLLAARDEAVRLGHEYLDTAHLLLALMDAPSDSAAHYLKRFAIDRPRVERVAALAGSVAARGPDMPYTARAIATLNLAMTEARDHARARVGTEHLLLGLVRADSVLADILGEAGATETDIRRSFSPSDGSDSRRSR